MATSSNSAAGLLVYLGVIVTVLLHGNLVLARNIDIDLSGSGCDRAGDYYIGDDDIAYVFHRVPYNTRSTRADCTVTLSTSQGQRLEYIIDDGIFKECGVQISIFDRANNVEAKSIVDCYTVNNLPIKSKTNFNLLRIYLRKTNVQTDNFQFGMKVINDKGRDIDSKIDDGKDFDNEKEALDPGAIIGIAIAGVVFILALVLLAIYLCIKSRKNYKDNASSVHGESSVYTSGNSQHVFANKQYPKRRYGSTEDVRSTTSSQEKTNGAYYNTAYSTDPVEKKSNRSGSIGRSRSKTGFTNESFEQNNTDVMQGNSRHWEEDEDYEVRIGSFRKSRKDSFKEKNLKSAMKKKEPPSEIEMSKVNPQPINSILKKSRKKSPNRSQTSSTEGSMDATAMVYGYNRSTTDHPNVKHKPVLERRRSRSGTRSNRSGSSGGHSSRRSQSADRKAKPKPGNNSRMYGEVFIDERNNGPRSSSRNRARSNSLRSRRDRGSDSVDSESSVTSSRRVNMNPGLKRVQIKGEETDI